MQSASPSWLERIQLDESLVLSVGEIPQAHLSVHSLESERLTMRSSVPVQGDGSVSIATVRTAYGAQVFVGKSLF